MRISDWSSDVCSSDLGGWWFATAHPDIARSPAEAEPVSLGTLAAIGAAMTPIMFAYGGWQTSGFVAGEMRNPGRDLGRGLLLGVTGVVLLSEERFAEMAALEDFILTKIGRAPV